MTSSPTGFEIRLTTEGVEVTEALNAIAANTSGFLGSAPPSDQTLSLSVRFGDKAQCALFLDQARTHVRGGWRVIGVY